MPILPANRIGGAHKSNVNIRKHPPLEWGTPFLGHLLAAGVLLYVQYTTTHTEFQVLSSGS